MALSLVHAFSPPCHLAGLGRGSSLAGRVRGSASAAHMQRRRASSSGVLCLRAVDMSLAVSDTPPEEDPLADIPAIKMHTADGTCTLCLCAVVGTGTWKRTQGHGQLHPCPAGQPASRTDCPCFLGCRSISMLEQAALWRRERC